MHVEVASRTRRGWPSFWVRLVRPSGSVAERYEFDRLRDAVRYAERLCRERGIAPSTIVYLP